MKFDISVVQLATVRQLEYIEAIEKHGSERAAARALGVNQTSVNKAIKGLLQRAKGETNAAAFKHDARIAVLDIETSPILAYVWSLWKQNVGLNQIHTDWSILSFSYKWLDGKRVLHHSTGGRGADKVRDDKEVMKLLWEVLNEADIIVAQNGVSFDVKKINARFIELKMSPPAPFKVVDTMLEARRIAKFTSNRLAWLSSVLTDTPKSEHKKFPGFELWTECLADNPEAWKEMRRYNDIDIRATEAVYYQLRPYIIGHPNVAAYDDDDTRRCPKCGSANLHSRGFALTQTGQYKRYQCGTCYGWSRTRYTENTREKRRTLMAN